MNLYLNSASDFSITDDDGKKYTPEEAKQLVKDGKVKGCNQAFYSLELHDFDIQALKDYYEEITA